MGEAVHAEKFHLGSLCPGRRWPAPWSVVRVGAIFLYARHRTFMNLLALEFGKHRKHLSHEPAGRSGEVKLLGDADKANAGFQKLIYGQDRVCHASAPAIEFPNNYHVNAPLPSKGQQLFTFWPCVSLPGFFLAKLGDHLPALPLAILPAISKLVRYGLLIFGGDAGIQDGLFHRVSKPPTVF